MGPVCVVLDCLGGDAGCSHRHHRLRPQVSHPGPQTVVAEEAHLSSLRAVIQRLGRRRNRRPEG